MKPEEIGRWIHAIGKHLKVYSDPRLALLFATRQSATDGELLLRIRGLGRISYAKFEALALDVGIAKQEMPTTLTRLESTSLVTIERLASSGKIIAVAESIFTEREVFRAINTLFENADPLQAERAIVPQIELLSRLPMTEAESIDRVCRLGLSEEDAVKALELQEAFGLLRRQRVGDFGTTLLHNEYLWGHKIEKIGAILAKLGRNETDSLLALIDEVRLSQGLSLDRISAAPEYIVQMAARTGILDTTTIITSTGREKTFAFSPHFYGYRTGPQSSVIEDHSDQVKLFVASIAYGVHHSEDFQLHSPIAFINKLLREGEAGNATPIARDYLLLEKQGIISVRRHETGLGTFILQKRDVIEQARDVMASGTLLRDTGDGADPRSLVTQRGVRQPEVNRLVADFGKSAGATAKLDEEIMSAIRDEVLKGTWL